MNDKSTLLSDYLSGIYANKTPQRIVEFTWHKDFSDNLSTEPQPSTQASYTSDDWEITFQVDQDGLQKIGSNVIFSKIPDILGTYTFSLMSTPITVSTLVVFDPLEISIDQQNQKLVFQLPIKANSLIEYVGKKYDLTGCRITVNIPINQAHINIQWNSDFSAGQIILALDTPKFEVDLFIKGGDPSTHAFLSQIINLSNPVLSQIISHNVKDQLILMDFKVPSEHKFLIHLFRDALPTRAGLSLTKTPNGNTTLAVRIICTGNYIAKTAEPSFVAGESNLAFRISNGLLLNGTLRSALYNILKELNASLPSNAIAYNIQPNLNIRTNSSIKLDNPSNLMKRPLFQGYIKSLQDLEEYQDNFDFSFGFDTSLAKNLITLRANGDLDLHKNWVGSAVLKLAADVTYALGFETPTLGTGIYFKASPTSLKFIGDIYNTSSIGEKIFQKVVFFVLVTLVFQLLTQLLGLILMFILGLFFGKEIIASIKTIDKAINTLDGLKGLLLYSQVNPTDVKGFIDRLNDLRIFSEKVDLNFSTELPAKITVAQLGRIDANGQSLDVYGQYIPIPLPPRPTPPGIIPIYEYQEAGTNHWFYSSAETMPALKENAGKTHSYQKKGVAFLAFKEDFPETVPVYQHILTARMIMADAPGQLGAGVIKNISYINSFLDAKELDKKIRQNFHGRYNYSVESISEQKVAFYIPTKSILSSLMPAYIYQTTDRNPDSEALRFSDRPIQNAAWKQLEQKFYLFPK